MKRILVFALACALSASFACCGKKKEAEPKPEAAPAAGTIVDVISGDGRFSTLAAAIETAGLGATLAGEGPFTLFAPPDSVFAKLPPGAAESLLQDVPALKNILLYHVVPGRIMAADLGKIPTAATLLGDPLPIEVGPGGAVTVGGAPIVRPDVPASNGVIHVIDKLLLPPEKTAG
jgi:transforming growth factor-beta-induced protein